MKNDVLEEGSFIVNGRGFFFLLGVDFDLPFPSPLYSTETVRFVRLCLFNLLPLCVRPGLQCALSFQGSFYGQFYALLTKPMEWVATGSVGLLNQT